MSGGGAMTPAVSGDSADFGSGVADSGSGVGVGWDRVNAVKNAIARHGAQRRADTQRGAGLGAFRCELETENAQPVAALSLRRKIVTVNRG